jgi:hypothetical protein
MMRSTAPGVGTGPREATGLLMPARERILEKVVGYFTRVGMTLPAAYVLSMGLSELSGHLARSDVLGSIVDCVMLLSVPWEAVATVLVILRWRDLPQRFWITYCVNGVLTYVSLPIYLHHFGIFL